MQINTDTNNFIFSDYPSLSLSSLSAATPHPNPRKKRTKFLKVTAAGGGGAKPRPIKKPDPSAPKITPPCTECGKKFWSWKALFGHMRCHPERRWRGINPPPFLCSTGEESTAEDHEVAACLLLLANGPSTGSDTTVCPPDFSYSDRDHDPPGLNRFECASCKKVFGSHQALGGHRASHKNVKGCYAINRNDGEEGCCSGEMMMMILKGDGGNNGHRCGVCFRVFSSGQALGGHMRCHWEKVEEPSRVCGFDLNMAAVKEDEDDVTSLPCSDSGGVALDLRLGF